MGTTKSQYIYLHLIIRYECNRKHLMSDEISFVIYSRYVEHGSESLKGSVNELIGNAGETASEDNTRYCCICIIL